MFFTHYEFYKGKKPKAISIKKIRQYIKVNKNAPGKDKKYELLPTFMNIN